jgi:hypothetical protein
MHNKWTKKSTQKHNKVAGLDHFMSGLVEVLRWTPMHMFLVICEARSQQLLLRIDFFRKKMNVIVSQRRMKCERQSKFCHFHFE